MTHLQQLQESWTGSRNAAPRKDPTFKFKLSRFVGRLDRVRERGGDQSSRIVEEQPEKGHSLLKEICAEGGQRSEV